VSGAFPTGVIRLRANISSQFVSSILMCAPCASSTLTLDLNGDAEHDQTNSVVSRPFIDMTIQIMKRFGAVVREPHPNIFIVEPTGYVSPPEYVVEGDATAASYHLALAAVSGG
jgi:5-enolpyruvylshikimate-3-phosphate synthase